MVDGKTVQNVYPLASRQRYLFDKCLLPCVQTWTPDDGWKDHPKHAECHSKIKQIWYIGASCWFYYRNNITMHGSMNVKFLTPSLLWTKVLVGVMHCCCESSQHFKDAKVLQNVGNYLPNSRVTHSRRLESSATLLSQPQVLKILCFACFYLDQKASWN